MILTLKASMLHLHNVFAKLYRVQGKYLEVYFNLNNYFGLHVCLSFRTEIKLFLYLQYLVCVKSEKYAFWITLRLLGSMRQGKTKLRTIYYKVRRSRDANIRTHFSVSSPPQCWSQEVVCVSTPRMYPRTSTS